MAAVQTTCRRMVPAAWPRAEASADGPCSCFPVSVTLAQADARQATAPDEPVHLAQRHLSLRAVITEPAQVRLLRYLQKQGEASPCIGIISPRSVAVVRPQRHIPCHRFAAP